MFKLNKAPQIVKLILPLLLLLLSQPSFAQFSPIQYKSTSGRINLDEGTAKQDYLIKITVREHDIDFRQICNSVPFHNCYYATVYPVDETFTTTVRMRRGTSSVGYRVNRGLFDGLYSSIKIECQNCSGVYPTQYHTPSGSELDFSRASIYGYGDFPSVVNLELLTSASIQGKISLVGGVAVDQDLDLTVQVRASSNSLLRASKNVRLAKGATSVNYQILGLSKTVAEPSYSVEIKCNNCGLKGARKFPRLLASDRSHSGVNFAIELGNAGFMPAILNFLLDDPRPR